MTGRMLKTLPISPDRPGRAETRPVPGFVLGSLKSSTYPTWGESLPWHAQGGRVEYSYASGFFSPSASLAGKERVLGALGEGGCNGVF